MQFSSFSSFNYRVYLLFTCEYLGFSLARKPYTITKQREKWTEKEHQRFLEALRLYGRGWRQIEGGS
ncbi:hypothetical protein V6Z11_A07G222000 [Gossypium hirsutum]